MRIGSLIIEENWSLAVRFANLRPMLAVADLPAVVRFYVEKLGFNCCAMHGNPPVWAEVERDGVAVMFNAPPRECVERDVPLKSKDYQIFYFNVDDAAGLHAAWKGAGLAVSDLRVMPYRMKEFDLRDPEGHWLMFGQETDEPPTVRE